MQVQPEARRSRGAELQRAVNHINLACTILPQNVRGTRSLMACSKLEGSGSGRACIYGCDLTQRRGLGLWSRKMDRLSVQMRRGRML